MSSKPSKLLVIKTVGFLLTFLVAPLLMLVRTRIPAIDAVIWLVAAGCGIGGVICMFFVRQDRNGNFRW